MASLIQYRPGFFSIQFADGNEKRPLFYLGRIERKPAMAILAHVENIISAKASKQALPMATAAWLAEIGPRLHRKLAKARLCAFREAEIEVRLAKFLDNYIKSRTDLKPRSIINLTQVRNGLVKFFGDDRDIRTITRGDIADWHRGLKLRFATATVAWHVKKAKQFFADALDRKFIDESPLKKLKAGSMANQERFEYVTLDTIAKVIDACPSIGWKVIFGLARYAALRTPSESNALRWEDVHWDKNRLVVRSSKTEHHEGKASRVVPISPALLPLLRDAFEQAEEGAVYVLGELRFQNPGTQGIKIIERAGVPQWKKIFQNLRSSCETDWMEFLPIHVACAFAGNSELVARKHYLQVTDRHFAAVTGEQAEVALASSPASA